MPIGEWGACLQQRGEGVSDLSLRLRYHGRQGSSCPPCCCDSTGGQTFTSSLANQQPLMWLLASREARRHFGDLRTAQPDANKHPPPMDSLYEYFARDRSSGYRDHSLLASKVPRRGAEMARLGLSTWSSGLCHLGTNPLSSRLAQLSDVRRVNGPTGRPGGSRGT